MKRDISEFKKNIPTSYLAFELDKNILFASSQFTKAFRSHLNGPPCIRNY